MACKAVSANLKDVKAEIYVIQQMARYQCFLCVSGIMEPGLTLMELVGTIKLENVIIIKTIILI